MEFSEWLAAEMAVRELGVRKLARLAGVGPGSVSRILNGSRSPGPELCQAIARALEVPQIEVFERAGHLDDPWSKLFARLSSAQRDIILAEMQAMVATEDNQKMPLPANSAES